MARTETVLIEITDDLDGSPAAETIAFAIDGQSFEIDLSKRNAASLRRALRPYVAAGRETRKRGRPAKSASAGRRRGHRSQRKTLHSSLSDEDKRRFRSWAVRRNLTTRSARRIADSAVEAWIDAGRPR